MDKTLTQASTTVVVKEPSALFARGKVEGVSLGFLPKFQFKEMHPNYLKFHLCFYWACIPNHGSIGLNFSALHQ